MVQVPLEIRLGNEAILAPVVVVIVHQSLPQCIETMKLMERVDLHEIHGTAMLIIAHAPGLRWDDADIRILLHLDDVLF